MAAAMKSGTSLNALLQRLILLCVLPLLLLAIYLAWSRMQDLQETSREGAARLATNFATALDEDLLARISGLQVLAASTQADNPPQLASLYQEALVFRDSFGGEVIFADTSMQVLLHTRSAFGATLPKLPQPAGFAAAPHALSSGRPAISDRLVEPIAQEPLVAVAVPVNRSGKPHALLLNLIQTVHLQRRLDEFALPADWVMSIRDGSDNILARRPVAPSTGNVGAGEAPERFVSNSTVSRWSVVLEIPRAVFLVPMIEAGATVLALILATSLLSIVAGNLAARRLARAVATLTATALLPASPRPIAEIERIRQALDDSRTLRASTEASLRESEARYRELFECNPQPMWTFDLGTLAFLSVNDAAIAQYGYSREEFLSMTIREIRPPQDLPLLDEDLKLAKLGLREAQTWRHRRKDGSIITVETAAHTLTLGGRSARLILAHDVTARARAEEQLRVNEQSLSITLQSIGDAVIATDTQGVITRMNDTAERLTGWPVSAARGRPLSDVFRTINALSREPSVNPVQQVMEHGGVVEIANHTTLLAQDGHEVQIADSAAPIRNVDGNIVGVVLVFRDVTEAYNVRQELVQTAAVLERVSELAKVGGWELDLRTMTLFWSRETCRIHEADSLTAPSLERGMELFSPEARPIMQAAMDAAITDGTPYDLELQKFTLKGRAIWIRTQGLLIMENGKVIKLVGALQDITERKRAEAALQESERRYREMVEWTPEPITVYQDGIIVYVNPATIRMCGAASAGDMVGKSVLELVHPASRDAARARMLRLAAGDAVAPMVESRVLKFDGQVIDVEVQSVAIAFNGKPAVHVAIRDITLPKQAEKAVRASAVFTRAILDSVTAEIAVLDKNGTVIAVNEPWRHFAIENSSLKDVAAPRTGIGVNYLAVCVVGAGAAADESANMARDGIQAVLDGRLPYFAMEYPCHSPGQQRWFILNVTPFGGEDGGVVVSHSNITERKQAEAARMAIVNSSMDAIITVDENERVLVFNPAAESLFMLSAAAALGQTLERFIPARFRQRHHGGFRTFMAAPGVTRSVGQFTPLTALRQDGLEFPIEASISHVITDSKHFFTMTLRDVSERAEAEAIRESLEEQLRESQKMQAMGTLAGGIAHDFNNILATILGNVDLAREELGNNARVGESLLEIRKAGRRARDLVQQILSFSRRQPTELVPTTLGLVVEDAVRLMRATLPARVKIEAHCDPEVPLVSADATQIKQVLINLGTNAAQAMRSIPGHIRINLDTVTLATVRADEHPALLDMLKLHVTPPGCIVRLTVTDDGPGMDAATRKRMFEPFFTTKPAGEGTGLGLSVVHGIVQAHDGAIAVESEPGKGATFTLYLPPALVQAEAAAPDEIAVAPTTCAPGGQHILYIDDDEALVFLVQRLMTRRGCRISGYTSQQEALNVLRASPATFDLVVTDYNMPGMSGLDVAHEVRAIRADLPVAIASGFIDETLRAQAETAGVRELIFKASAVEDLCDAFLRLALTVAVR